MSTFPFIKKSSYTQSNHSYGAHLNKRELEQKITLDDDPKDASNINITQLILGKKQKTSKTHSLLRRPYTTHTLSPRSLTNNLSNATLHNKTDGSNSSRVITGLHSDRHPNQIPVMIQRSTTYLGSIHKQLQQHAIQLYQTTYQQQLQKQHKKYFGQEFKVDTIQTVSVQPPPTIDNVNMPLDSSIVTIPNPAFVSPRSVSNFTPTRYIVSAPSAQQTQLQQQSYTNLQSARTSRKSITQLDKETPGSLTERTSAAATSSKRLSQTSTNPSIRSSFTSANHESNSILPSFTTDKSAASSLSSTRPSTVSLSYAPPPPLHSDASILSFHSSTASLLPHHRQPSASLYDNDVSSTSNMPQNTNTASTASISDRHPVTSSLYSLSSSPRSHTRTLSDFSIYDEQFSPVSSSITFDSSATIPEHSTTITRSSNLLSADQSKHTTTATSSSSLPPKHPKFGKPSTLNTQNNNELSSSTPSVQLPLSSNTSGMIRHNTSTGTSNKHTALSPASTIARLNHNAHSKPSSVAPSRAVSRMPSRASFRHELHPSSPKSTIRRKGGGAVAEETESTWGDDNTAQMLDVSHLASNNMSRCSSRMSYSILPPATQLNRSASILSRSSNKSVRDAFRGIGSTMHETWEQCLKRRGHRLELDDNMLLRHMFVFDRKDVRVAMKKFVHRINHMEGVVQHDIKEFVNDGLTHTFRTRQKTVQNSAQTSTAIKGTENWFEDLVEESREAVEAQLIEEALQNVREKDEAKQMISHEIEILKQEDEYRHQQEHLAFLQWSHEQQEQHRLDELAELAHWQAEQDAEAARKLQEQIEHAAYLAEQKRLEEERIRKEEEEKERLRKEEEARLLAQQQYEEFEKQRKITKRGILHVHTLKLTKFKPPNKKFERENPTLRVSFQLKFNAANLPSSETVYSELFTCKDAKHTDIDMEKEFSFEVINAFLQKCTVTIEIISRQQARLINKAAQAANAASNLSVTVTSPDGTTVNTATASPPNGSPGATPNMSATPSQTNLLSRSSSQALMPGTQNGLYYRPHDKIRAVAYGDIAVRLIRRQTNGILRFPVVLRECSEHGPDDPASHIPKDVLPDNDDPGLGILIMEFKLEPILVKLEGGAQSSVARLTKAKIKKHKNDSDSEYTTDDDDSSSEEEEKSQQNQKSPVATMNNQEITTESLFNGISPVTLSRQSSVVSTSPFRKNSGNVSVNVSNTTSVAASTAPSSTNSPRATIARPSSTSSISSTSSNSPLPSPRSSRPTYQQSSRVVTNYSNIEHHSPKAEKTSFFSDPSQYAPHDLDAYDCSSSDEEDHTASRRHPFIQSSRTETYSPNLFRGTGSPLPSSSSTSQSIHQSPAQSPSLSDRFKAAESRQWTGSPDLLAGFTQSVHRGSGKSYKLPSI